MMKVYKINDKLTTKMSEKQEMPKQRNIIFRRVGHYCKICDRKFNSLKLVTLHTKITHNVDYKFECGDCGKNVQMNENFRDIIRNITQ